MDKQQQQRTIGIIFFIELDQSRCNNISAIKIEWKVFHYYRKIYIHALLWRMENVGKQEWKVLKRHSVFSDVCIFKEKFRKLPCFNKFLLCFMTKKASLQFCLATISVLDVKVVRKTAVTQHHEVWQIKFLQLMVQKLRKVGKSWTVSRFRWEKFDWIEVKICENLMDFSNWWKVWLLFWSWKSHFLYDFLIKTISRQLFNYKTTNFLISMI